MKVSVIFIFILLLSRVTGFTQGYHPIPEEGVIWQEHEFRTIIPCIYHTTFLYYFDGDTVVANIHYKKLVSERNDYSSCSGVPYPSISFYPKQYEGAFRQDTILHTAYFIGKTNYTENLLYDFNLTVGDSLYFLVDSNYNWWIDIISNPAVIEAVDSVLIEGTFRKRMRYLQAYNACGVDTIALIEGIGNTRGFIYPRLYPCSIYKTIECVSIDGNRIYGSGDTCYHEGEVGYSSVESISPNEFLLEAAYAADGSIQIRCNVVNLNDPKLLITNVLGERIKTVPLNYNNSIVLTKDHLLPGCYFLSLYDGGKILESKKAIIH